MVLNTSRATRTFQPKPESIHRWLSINIEPIPAWFGLELCRLDSVPTGRDQTGTLLEQQLTIRTDTIDSERLPRKPTRNPMGYGAWRYERGLLCPWLGGHNNPIGPPRARLGLAKTD
jgi:hypothetical protein